MTGSSGKNRGVRLPPPSIALVAICVAILTLQAQLGDYVIDAGPAIGYLISGDLRSAIHVQPLMGSFSVLIRAPFALVAKELGASRLGIYRAGVVPCLAACGALGLALASLKEVQARWGARILVPVLAVLTPVSVAAVTFGHPEEALGAALCVSAVLLAGRGSTVWAGIALGLALATKQWAVLAILPVLLAAHPRQRLRVSVIAAATAIALTLPLFVGDTHAFRNTTHNAATATQLTTRATVWFLVAEPIHEHLALPAGIPSHIRIYRIPEWAARLSHPLIVLLALPLTFLVWRRGARPTDPLALLAFLFLIRCALDPVDNEYYHLPFLLALLAWECRLGRFFKGVPPGTLVAIAGLWFIFERLNPNASGAQLTNAVYLVWAAAAALYLLHGMRLVRVPRRS